MLADDLVAAASRPDDTRSGGRLARLAEDIKKAQRYVITREVIASARAVLDRPVAEQLKALRLCRLPFAVVWLEWPLGSGCRQGVIITTDNGNVQRGTCARAESDGHLVVATPELISFDWSEEPAAVSDTPETITEDGWSAITTAQPWIRQDKREAWIAFMQRHAIAVDPDLVLPADVPEDVFDKLTGEALLALGYARVIILLMHAKNVIGIEPQRPPDKLQKARVRSGKAPLLDHTRIDIKLSKAMAARAGETADPRNPTRLHLVSGHFKIRKTGIFWWSDYTRGSLEAGEIKSQVRRIAA